MSLSRKPLIKQEVLRDALVRWYTHARRDLPWRRTRDPYAIWVSEVMLQQTQVKTVMGYYERWMQRFPTVKALAAAEDADVLHAWQGLGYYSRARRLLAGARAVAERHDGQLPSNVDALRALPGIGPYSAGAIASIAFGLPEPIVDGNVVRVLSRIFALRGDPAKSPLKRELWRLARELAQGDDPATLNQSLMELGATICTPTSPRCPECPVREQCQALAQGLERDLPELAKRKVATEVRTSAAYVREGERVLLRQMPADAARWAGLWVLPFVELREAESALAGAERALREVGAEGRAGAVLREARHTITRFRITLSIVACELGGRSTLPSGLGLFAPSQVEKLALPSIHSRLLQTLARA